MQQTSYTEHFRVGSNTFKGTSETGKRIRNKFPLEEISMVPLIGPHGHFTFVLFSLFDFSVFLFLFYVPTYTPHLECEVLALAFLVFSNRGFQHELERYSNHDSIIAGFWRDRA